MINHEDENLYIDNVKDIHMSFENHEANDHMGTLHLLIYLH